MNKFDYLYIKENKKTGWQQHWMNLLDGRWIVEKNELIEGRNAPLFRLGFTVEEVEQAIGHTGYTPRQLEWYQSQPERYNLIDGQYVETDGWAEANAQAELQAAIDKKLSELQQEKVKRRDAGIAIDGTVWDTDINAQVMYTQYLLETLSNPNAKVPDWKASRGQFTEMNPTVFMQIRSAWMAHCTGITAAQRAKEAEVKALTTVEAVEEYDCSVGW